MKARHILGAMGFVLTLLADAAVAATPVKVIDTPAKEASGGIAEGWVGWSTFTNGAWKAFVRPDGASARKIPTADSAFIGDIVLDGPRAGQAVFWQFEGLDGQIKFYDLDTRNVLHAPAGVNTRKSEEFASASGDYMLFGRGPVSAVFQTQVNLYRFSTNRTRRIASANEPILTSDQVNGDYVAYTRCRNPCSVTRYRVSTGRSLKMPAPPVGRANYYGAVLPDGTVYYVQGNQRQCGKNTKMLRLRDGNVTTVTNMPDGIEMSALSADVVGGGPVVVFTRFNCATGRTGVYKVAG